jgi:hypothetical protein
MLILSANIGKGCENAVFLSAVERMAPILQPAHHIICAGLTYLDHAEEVARYNGDVLCLCSDANISGTYLPYSGSEVFRILFGSSSQKDCPYYWNFPCNCSFILYALYNLNACVILI